MSLCYPIMPTTPWNGIMFQFHETEILWEGYFKIFKNGILIPLQASRCQQREKAIQVSAKPEISNFSNLSSWSVDGITSNLTENVQFLITFCFRVLFNTVHCNRGALIHCCNRCKLSPRKIFIAVLESCLIQASTYRGNH